jgi:hypothetical protein
MQWGGGPSRSRRHSSLRRRRARLSRRSESVTALRDQRAFETAQNADAPGKEAINYHEAAEGSDGSLEDYETQLRRRDESVRTNAQYEMRVADFEKSAPDFRDTVTSVMSVFPPAEHIAQHLLESPVGPKLAYLFANNIDSIEEFNAMPPKEALKQLARAEGILMAQQAGQQQPGQSTQGHQGAASTGEKPA